MLSTPQGKKYIQTLEKRYAKRFTKSKEVFAEGAAFYPNQASHAARTFKPFPPFIKSAAGNTVTTVDDIELLDYWQGHFCNILGHNHPVLIEALQTAIDHQLGLQLGLLTTLENELSSLLKETTGLESYIFTSSGTLSTMSAIMLGLSHTKRSGVLKLEGGWHGAQPWSLVSVKYPEGINHNLLESSGVPRDWVKETMTVPLNDVEALQQRFDEDGDRIGVFILELVLGNSGMVMASKEFIQEARKLTRKHGAVLVIDEMVTGFRVHAGGLFELYEIDPDLVTFGKVVSGGMPFACIAGKKEILAQASASQKSRVWADGGTFNSHPASLSTAIAVIRYLREREQDIYPSILQMMDTLRSGCKEIMNKHGILVDVTGTSNDDSMPNFPIGTIRFIKEASLYEASRAVQHWNKEALDIDLRDRISKIALMLKGIYTWQGLGVVTHAHTDEDINRTLSSYEDFASEISEIIN